MNDKLKKLALNRRVESRSIGNTMHVVLLLCNGACNVNKGCIYIYKKSRHVESNRRRYEYRQIHLMCVV